MGVQRRLFQNDAACNGLFVEAGWRIYASLKWVNVGSGNCLSPVRRQAITWTNDYLLSIRPIGKKFSDFVYRNSNIFIDEIAFDNVVCQSGGHLVSASMCYHHQCTFRTPLAMAQSVELVCAKEDIETAGIRDEIREKLEDKGLYTITYPTDNIGYAKMEERSSRYQWVVIAIHSHEVLHSFLAPWGRDKWLPFDRHHFYLRPVFAFMYCRWLHLSVCPCVCLCFNPKHVCTITRHPTCSSAPVATFIFNEVLSYHISYHIVSYRIVSYRIISCSWAPVATFIFNEVLSYHMISYHIISYFIPYIISYHITSYHITRPAVEPLWLHSSSMKSCHIVSYHIISYHIISYHIIYHIIS